MFSPPATTITTAPAREAHELDGDAAEAVANKASGRLRWRAPRRLARAASRPRENSGMVALEWWSKMLEL